MVSKIQNGHITDDGQLYMFMGEVNDFFSKHKGCKVVAEFTVLKKLASEALKGYYYLSVVPDFRKALWSTGERKTQEQTDEYLRSISPIMYEEIPNVKIGKYSKRIREIHELSNAELIDHVEFLKQFAAENFFFYIEDPKQF